MDCRVPSRCAHLAPVMPAAELILRMAVNDPASGAARSSSELPRIPLPPRADSAIQAAPAGEHLAFDQMPASVSTLGPVVEPFNTEVVVPVPAVRIASVPPDLPQSPRASRTRGSTGSGWREGVELLVAATADLDEAQAATAEGVTRPPAGDDGPWGGARATADALAPDTAEAVTGIPRRAGGRV